MLWVLVVLPLALTALAVWLGPLVLNPVERSQCLDAGMQASQEKRKCEQR